MRNLPKANDQCWESNPRPLDLWSSALQTEPRDPTLLFDWWAGWRRDVLWHNMLIIVPVVSLNSFFVTLKRFRTVWVYWLIWCLISDWRGHVFHECMSIKEVLVSFIIILTHSPRICQLQICDKLYIHAYVVDITKSPQAPCCLHVFTFISAYLLLVQLCISLALAVPSLV